LHGSDLPSWEVVARNAPTIWPCATLPGSSQDILDGSLESSPVSGHLFQRALRHSTVSSHSSTTVLTGHLRATTAAFARHEPHGVHRTPSESTRLSGATRRDTDPSRIHRTLRHPKRNAKCLICQETSVSGNCPDLSSLLDKLCLQIRASARCLAPRWSHSLSTP
jgi:hypothetical protein